MSKFEQAVRMKLRFNTVVGSLNVENLWDLPIESVNGLSLKDLAIELGNKINSQPAKTLDFFEAVPTIDSTLQLQFDIVKHIVVTKLTENKAKSEEMANKSQQEYIKTIIAEKKKDDLKSKSVEELEALIKG